VNRKDIKLKPYKGDIMNKLTMIAILALSFVLISCGGSDNECEADIDCQVEHKCDNNICILGCNSSNGCKSGYHCASNGFCNPDCKVSNDCPKGHICPPNGICEVPSGNTGRVCYKQCQGGVDCKGMTLTYETVCSSRQCHIIGCIFDSDCPSGGSYNFKCVIGRSGIYGYKTGICCQNSNCAEELKQNPDLFDCTSNQACQKALSLGRGGGPFCELKSRYSKGDCYCANDKDCDYNGKGEMKCQNYKY